MNEKQIARNEAAFYQHPDWGIIQLTGDDRAQFIHNQTTNEIKSLKAGQGCRTVFVNSTGRTLDLATVYVTEETFLLTVSSKRTEFLMQWLDRYLFPMDRVTLKNVSQDYTIFTLLGEKILEVLRSLNINVNLEPSFASHETIEIDNIPVRLGIGTDIGLTGYTLIVPSENAAAIADIMTKAGAINLSETVWNELTLEQGRPLADYELTEDYNPLEAGLWEAISFDKGCYIGQETIARLNTYQGVKQRLWGLRLSQPVNRETPITLDEKKIGTLTRCLETEEGVKGLGYIRTKAGGEGLKVRVGEAEAEVIAVPFLSHPQ